MNYQVNSFTSNWIEPKVKVTREMIFRLQDTLIELQNKSEKPFKERGNTDDEFPLTHYFAPGLYGREILLPAGSIIVGKIHRHAHINTISKGKVAVATEFGLEEYSAPYTFVSKPGTKRAVYAIEDTIWTTYHPTDETDLDKIEDEIIAISFDDYEQRKLT